MSKSARTSSRISLEDIDWVVESDGHVFESLEMIKPYIDDDYEFTKKFIEKSPMPDTEIIPFPLPTAPFQYEFMGDEGSEAPTERDGIATASDMFHEHDIDYGILNPSILLATMIRHPNLARGIVNGYNNWLVDELDDYSNLKGNIVISPREPHRMAEEINRLADEKNMVGVEMHVMGAFPPLGHEHYDPIYEAVIDNDIPFSLHSAGSQYDFPKQFFEAETFVEQHVFGHPYEHIWNLTSMLLNGVPERHKDLTVVFQEAGIGYIPWLQKRLDDAYIDYGHDLPYLEKAPTEYIDEQFYWSTQPVGYPEGHAEYIAWQIEMAGPENIMFSADIPHADFDTPSELFDCIRPHFDNEILRGIMGETAKRVYGLDSE